MAAPSRARTLSQTARPPFLILMLVCILLGVAAAVAGTEGRVDGLLAGLILLGGLAAHIAVNMLNEYQDFRSGLDLNTVRTPFSGGSGALLKHPEAAPAVLLTSLIMIALTALIGLYLVSVSGPGLLPFGILGLVLVVTYTRWLNRNPWACLLAPGVAFGPLVVIGTCYALTGGFPMVAIWSSLVPLCLASNLLLVNQYPDLDADRAAGRRHLIIVHGAQAGLYAYGILALLAATVVVAGVMTGSLVSVSLVSLLPLGLSVVVYSGLREHLHKPKALQPYMALNVLVTLLVPLILALCLLASSF